MANKNDPKAIQPISTMIDELKNDDVKKRVNSVKNLSAIATALGPERTRNELVGFLNELIDDEDEVLLALAESLSNFVDFVGGPAHATSLLPPLEALSRASDSTTREKTIFAIKKLLQSIDLKKNEDTIFQFLKRLGTSEYYTSKNSASALIPHLFKNMSPVFQNELIQIYTSMAQDDIPMVRKFATIYFKDLISLIPTVPEAHVFSIFNNLVKDEQDFIRIYLIDDLVALAKAASPQKQAQVISFLKTLSEDNSWRIRYIICEKCWELGQAIGKENTKKVFLPYYIKFLQDPEPELRTIASSKIDKFCELLDLDDILGKICVILKDIANDNQPFVRAGFAQSVLAISSLVGKKNTTDYILPLFVSLLKDEDSEVRINVFKKLGDIAKVLGVENLSATIMPALNELCIDKNWRIRSSTIKYLPFFAKQIGETFFNEKIIKMLISWLTDRVYAVRQTAVVAIKDLGEILGVVWFEKNLLIPIINFQTNQNYMYRMNPLFIIQAAIKCISADTLSGKILPLVLSLAKDPIPNVRVNSAKALRSCYPFVKDKDTIKKTLSSLNDDVDQDVKVVAKQCLDSL